MSQFHFHCAFLVDVHSATIQFDIQDTNKAIGRLDCQNDIIDIVSIEYYSNSQHCDRIVCLKAPAADYSYFDGRNVVCSNEDNIRLRCSGEQSCEFGPEGVLATKPPDGCFTLTQRMTSTSMRIMHRCIPQGRPSRNHFSSANNFLASLLSGGFHIRSVSPYSVLSSWMS